MRELVKPVLAILFLSPAACAVDDAPLGEELQADTVLSPPTPHAGCTDCGDTVVGEWIGVYTAYYGTCEDDITGTYTCGHQSYDVTIECDQPCETLGAGFIQADPYDAYHATQVRPLAPGPMAIRIYMQGWLIATVTNRAHVPDRVEVTCRAGGSPWQDCTDGPNPPPIILDFGGLYAGTTPLQHAGPFRVTDNGIGPSYAGTWWQTSVPGLHVFEIGYMDSPVLTTFDVEVEAPPPVPPNGDRLAEPVRAVE
jgi:hypothetical protein